MRDIKFRAWNSHHKHMLFAGDFAIYNEPDNGFHSGDDCNNGDWVEYQLMQYTGIRDVNCVEIYEGDLLRIPAKDQYEETTYNCFEVFYHSNECIGGQNIGFCMNRMHTQGHSGGGYGYKFTPESISKNNFIVIGNIYQNPELMKT